MSRPALLAADLDGTLMDSATGPADPGVGEALRRAAASGITLCICTGRPTDVALAAARALGVDAGYAISYGGAETMALGTGPSAPGAEARPPGADVRPPSSEVRPAGAAVSGAGANAEQRLLDVHTHTFVLKTAAECGLDVAVHDSSAGVLRDVLAGTECDVDRAVAALRAIAGQSAALLRPSPNALAVQSAGATKALALQHLAARLRIAPGDVAYLGDADDDAAALEWAGFGVAVAAGAGGSPLAEAAADLVITRAGVAEVLERLATARRPRQASPRL